MKKLIYALKCPFTNEVHYIGKSSSGMIRPKQHLKESHSDKIIQWVDELKTFGQKPKIEILSYVSEEENLDEVEIYFINKHIKKGCYLLNIRSVHPLTISPKLDKDKTSNVYAISLFIKKRRKEIGMTQEEFSSYSGVGLRFLRELEQCKKENFSTQKINIVLSMFGCKLGIEKLK